MTDSIRSDCLRESLQDLQEDAQLLRLAILAAQDSMDALTHACLLRLCDYLAQHVSDVRLLCRRH